MPAGVHARVRAGAPAALLERPARGWRYFRRHPHYRAAWRARPGEAAYEPAAFPLRVQSAADLAAARFGLLAWEDPFDAAGPAAPFWAEAPRALAVPAPEELAGEVEPLAESMAREGAALSGLRLTGGVLLLKLEWGGYAAQLRLAGARTLDPAADRLLFARPAELALLAPMTCLADLSAQLGAPPGKPRAGCGRPRTTPGCWPRSMRSSRGARSAR